MIGSMEHGFSVRNATRAVTALAATPAGLLLRVEVLVTISCALLATLVFFGSGRRTSRSTTFRMVVWLALMLSYPAVSYTIGLMQSASFRNDLVVVWACFLLGCADGIAACSVDDSDNQARAMLNQAVQIVYVFLLLLSYVSYLEPKLKILLLLLWVLNVAKIGMRLRSLLAAGRARVLTAENWLITKYMSDEYVDDIADFDPETMKGYKYVVTGEKNEQDGSPEYKLDINDDHLVTVEKVWHCKGNLLVQCGTFSDKLKDLCLSFALFKLLRRRLSGSPLEESKDIRTLVFARRGLAGDQPELEPREDKHDHERMYRVIEMELGFLFDFIYARYPSPKQTLIPETAMFVVAVALSISIFFSSPLLHHPTPPEGNMDVITVTSAADLDVWLSRLVIVLFLILELFQYLSLVLSDWHKVKMLSRYVRKPSWHGRPILETLLMLMCRSTLTTRYWSNSVGQFSILDACFQNESSCLTVMPIHRRIKCLLIGTKMVTRKSLPVTVKRAIHRFLRSEWLSNIKYGDRTLEKNNLLWCLDWSTSRYKHGTVGSILVWHIATAICDNKLAAHGGTSQTMTETDNTIKDREVANTLSRYCAYLLFEAPELVTEEIHIYDTRLLTGAVQLTTEKYIQECRSTDTMFDKMTSNKSIKKKSSREETVLADGIRLGNQILEQLHEEAGRWKVLSEMWVELLLTVAPSGKVNGHVKKLATGGELITHLWAFLNHGGITEMQSKPCYKSNSRSQNEILADDKKHTS